MYTDFVILVLTLLGAISIIIDMEAEASLTTLIKSLGIATVLMLGVLAIMFNTETVEVKQPIIPSVRIETIQMDNKIVSDTTYIYNFIIKE